MIIKFPKKFKIIKPIHRRRR